MKIPDEIKQFFHAVPIMALSTTDNKGTPNVVAIGSKTIGNDDMIWVIDTFFKKTKENLLQNNKVAIALWDVSKLQVYQIKGVATYHSEGKIFEEAKNRILKVHPNKIVKGVVGIKATEIYSITPAYEEAGKRIV